MRRNARARVAVPAAVVSVMSLLLAGCSGSTSSNSTPTTTPSPNAQSPRQVIITQPNDGPQPVVDFINKAQKTLDFALYEFDPAYQPIVSAAQAAKDRGVKVRVMLSPTSISAATTPAPSTENIKAVAAFTKLGFEAKLASKKDFAWYHQKTIIVDGNEPGGQALIMDFNLAESYMSAAPDSYDANELGTRGMAAIDVDPADVKNIQQTFDADFNQVPWAGSTRPELVWAPAGSAYQPRGNAIKVFQEQISQATDTIDAYIQVFNYETTSLTLPYLLAAAKRGVKIRIITNQKGFVRPEAYTQLKAAGAEIVMQPQSYTDASKYLYIHCKTVVFDAGKPNQTVFVGSENPFLNDSLNEERELGVLVQDSSSITYVMSTFNRDFGVAKPYTS